MGKNDFERYELENLLGVLDDWELDYYLLSKQKIPSGINFIIPLQEISLYSKTTVGEILGRYFTFISDKGKILPKYRKIRNHLEKFFLYADEEYWIDIWFENKQLWSGELDELQWRELDQINLWNKVGKLTFGQKLKLTKGYFRVFVKLNSNFGKIRQWHEEEEFILDTEGYTKKIFYQYIIKPLRIREENEKKFSLLKFPLDPMLLERSKLWNVEVNFKKADNVPFSLFGADNVIHYWQILASFYEIKHNWQLFRTSRRNGQGYLDKMRDNYKALQYEQPIFLRGNFFKYSRSWREVVLLWIKILRK